MMMAPHKTPGAAKIKIFTIDFLKTCQSQLKAEYVNIYLIRKVAQG